MKERILIYNDGKVLWVEPDNICSLQASGSYTMVTLSNNQLIKVSKNLKNFLSSVPSACKQFYRVQKSHVVNLNFIEFMYINKSQKPMLHLKNGTDIPINSNVRNKLFVMYGLLDKFEAKASEKKVRAVKEPKQEPVSEPSNEDFLMIKINK